MSDANYRQPSGLVPTLTRKDATEIICSLLIQNYRTWDVNRHCPTYPSMETIIEEASEALHRVFRDDLSESGRTSQSTDWMKGRVQEFIHSISSTLRENIKTTDVPNVNHLALIQSEENEGGIPETTPVSEESCVLHRKEPRMVTTRGSRRKGTVPQEQTNDLKKVGQKAHARKLDGLENKGSETDGEKIGDKQKGLVIQVHINDRRGTLRNKVDANSINASIGKHDGNEGSKSGSQYNTLVHSY